MRIVRRGTIAPLTLSRFPTKGGRTCGDHAHPSGAQQPLKRRVVAFYQWRTLQAKGETVMRWTLETICLTLCLSVAAGAAKGDLITALSSSFDLTANAQAGLSPNVTDTDTDSQGSAINPLSVAVSATSVYAGLSQTLVATASGSAIWSTAAVGQVTYTDVGWSDTIGDGNANLNSNVGWIYSFSSNVTGAFVINYDVTALGTSTTTPSPLIGLNGFYLYEGTGLSPPSNATFETGLNTSGTVSLAITAGQTYSVHHPRFCEHLGRNWVDGCADGRHL